MYGGSYYPTPQDPRGPRIVPFRKRGEPPTISIEPEPTAANAATMLSTIATSFQATLGAVMQGQQDSAAQNAQILAQIAAQNAQTVANAVAQAQGDARERDMRLMLQLQRETLEESHNRELKRLQKEESEKEKKRQRTERPQDLP